MQAISAKLRGALLAGIAATVTACASGPEIRHDVNPSANFASYKTFGFFSPLATDRAGYQSVLTVRLKNATRREMESKGYVYTEANPDLLLNFYLNIQHKQDIVSTPSTMGYYGYRRGYYGGFGGATVETINYKTGTLSIDLVDPRQKVLIWQATAEGRIPKDANEHPGALIDSTVKEMMTPLPYAG